jgi:hypothetical protein
MTEHRTRQGVLSVVDRDVPASSSSAPHLVAEMLALLDARAGRRGHS